MLLLAGSALAQRSPKLLKCTSQQKSLKFEYDALGRVVRDVYSSEDAEEGVEFRTNTYAYSMNKIVQRYSEGSLMDTDSRTSILKDGKIVKETVVMNDDESGLPKSTYTLNFTYNADNQLVKVETLAGSGKNINIHEVTWADGCPSSIKTYREGVLVGEMNFTYDTSVTNPYIIAITNPFLHVLDYEAILPYGQLLEDSYGEPVKYAMRSVKYTEHVSHSYDWDPRDDFELAYTKNAKGEVVSAVQTGPEENETISFEWENATGISVHNNNGTGTDSYYRADGVRRTSTGKGLNIIRSADGTVRKVLK